MTQMQRAVLSFYMQRLVTSFRQAPEIGGSLGQQSVFIVHAHVSVGNEMTAWSWGPSQ